MYKGIVFVDGVGTREAKREFKNSEKDHLINFEGKDYKLNAAAASVIELNKKGYFVCFSDKCGNCIRRISKNLKEGSYLAKKADLLNKDDVESLTEGIKQIKNKLGNLEVHFVHYGSISSVKLDSKEESVFLHSWDVKSEHVGKIVESNIASFYNVLQSFKEIFKEQSKTKIIIISSLAAIRSGVCFGLDAIQKGAVHSMARTAALELVKDNIYITEIMPGTTDTGYYDLDFNLKQKIKRGKSFGYSWKENEIPIFSSKIVSEAVLFALESNSHVREISLIPYGQHPNLGA